jgi:ligand-binding sensor domain-containing protein/anti-sigma regulatory factor (Ser/Thr protein kinase)
MLLLTTRAFAQDPFYISINQSSGLPSNSVYDIIQDSRGYIWIASDEGISRYDGFEFKTYYSPSQTTTAGSALSEDKYGRIWYENFDGFIYYVENEKLKPLSQNSPIYFVTYGILDDELFVVQKGGIDVFDLKTLSLKKLIPIKQNYIQDAAGDGKFYYVIVDNNIMVINKKHEVFTYELPKGDALNSFKIYTVNNQKNVLATKINRSRQLYTLKDGKIIPLFEARSPSFIQMVSYTDEGYWLCSPEGLVGITPKGKMKNEGLPYFKKKNVSKVIKDRQGNIWISTQGEGLLLITDWTTKKYSLSDHRFSSIVKCADGFYLGTQNGEVLWISEFMTDKRTIFQDPSGHEITKLYYDEQYKSLFICGNKITVLKERSHKPAYEMTGAVKSISRIDEKYYAIAASGYCGLLLNPFTKSTSLNSWDAAFEKNKIVYSSLTITPLIEGIRGKSTACNPNGEIYFATNSGIFKCTPDGRNEEIRINNQPIYATNLSYKNGYLYVLTNQKVLIRSKNFKVWENLNEKLNLKENDAQKIFSDETHLFLVTSNSIIELNTEKEALNKRIYKISSDNISDMTMFEDKLYVIKDNNIISGIQPYDKSENKVNPLFWINSLSVNGVFQDSLKNLTFDYARNNIEINYSLLDFGNKSLYDVYYSINEGPWQHLSNKSRTLRFPELPPGDYKISLGISDRGEPFEMDYVSFRITPPFWKTYWFFGLISLLFVILGYLIFFLKTKELNRKNEAAREKMQLEKELSKSILKSIKSQMNPHFFYNALNTVQSFIFADDKRNAGNYLAKFSKLTRMILEMSERELIFLSEEITALTLYLDLEKMRFGNDFTYSINISENIEQENIKFPPMLIQPYVENALKHGLLHKEGEKTLRIDFTLRNNVLQVIIEDNGIGRKKSEELNKIRKDKHDSFAGKANATRLEILNRGQENKVGVVIEDLYSAAGNPIGTRVIIQIPNHL